MQYSTSSQILRPMNTKDQQRYGTTLSQEALLLKIVELKHILDTVRILILDWSYTFPLIEMTRVGNVDRHSGEGTE